IEAIFAACDDAGLSPRAIDGVVRYDMETTDEENLVAALGNPAIRYQASTSWGGGGSVSVLVHAAAAIATGMADTLLVFRSRAPRPRSSGRITCSAAATGSAWASGSPGSTSGTSPMAWSAPSKRWR